MPPGQIIDTPLSSLDLLPSFCKLADVELPAELKPDGAVMLPQPGDRKKPLVWCYYNAINDHRVAMRHGDWKVLAKMDKLDGKKFSNLHSGNAENAKSAKLTDIEIYRVTDDIAESKNLAKVNPEELKRLTELVNSAYAELISDSPVWQPRTK